MSFADYFVSTKVFETLKLQYVRILVENIKD